MDFGAELRADALALIAKAGLMEQTYGYWATEGKAEARRKIEASPIRGMIFPSDVEPDLTLTMRLSEEITKLLTTNVEQIGSLLDYYPQVGLLDSLNDAKYIRDSAKSYWSALKQEFVLLVCTDDKKYKDLRVRIDRGTNSTALVSAIAVGISAHMGIAAGILTPFCALCLIALARMGKEAFCRRDFWNVHI